MPLLWRADTVAQIGDGDRRVVLDRMDRELITWLFTLNGERTLDTALDAAEASGLGRHRPLALLHAVALTGILDDAAIMPASLREAPLHVRDRLAHDIAATRHAHGEASASADAMERRRTASVAVHGDGPVADAVVLALTQAGIGRVIREAPQRSSSRKGRRVSAERDFQVLCHSVHPEIFDDAGAVTVDVPHLPVVAFGARAVVGPLVIPGVTGCLRCMELHQVDADPAWPRVSAQLAHWHWESVPIDSALAHMSAAWAALHVLAWVESADREDRVRRGWTPTWATPPPAYGHRLHLHLPGGEVTTHRAPAHPLCGCRWPAAA